MSTYVILLRDRDDPIYQRYLKVLLACKEAGILDVPQDVDAYFGGGGIDNDPEAPLAIEFNAREWHDEGRAGFEIDLDELPSGVKTIRFYNAW